MLFKVKKDAPETTEVDNLFIRSYLPSAPELALKAYIYGLMLAGSGEEADIGDALGAEENDVKAAFFWLEKQGLVETVEGEHPQILFRKPERFGEAPDSSGKYSSLVKELSNVLGTRVLSGAELSRIYDWIDVYGFDQDAAVLIVRRCLDVKGAKTSVAYMDRVAKTLAGEGRFGFESVREHFEEEELLRSGAAKILKRWNRGRPPTEDEIALYEKWTKAWGFNDEALDLALSKMTSAESPSFAYLDGIISGLRQGGSTDAASIAELGRRDDAAYELARLAFARAGLKRTPDRDAKAQFAEWHFDWCMSAELILCAADFAKTKTHPYAYMKELLNGWHKEGIATPAAAAESYEKRSKTERSSGKRTRALNYIHGDSYSKEKLKELGISFGEELYGDDKE